MKFYSYHPDAIVAGLEGAIVYRLVHAIAEGYTIEQFAEHVTRARHVRDSAAEVASALWSMAADWRVIDALGQDGATIWAVESPEDANDIADSIAADEGVACSVWRVQDYIGPAYSDTRPVYRANP